MDLRQSDLWAKYLEELGWQVHALTSNSFAYSKKVPLLGKVVKIPRVTLPLPLKQIETLVAQGAIFFVKIEPTIETNEANLENIFSLLKNSGFTHDRWPLSPTRTIKVD